MTITGFKSTDIESRSKVEPATVANFGYKRQGLDVNALGSVYLLTTTTCSAGTTSTKVVMSPSVTVLAGDLLEFGAIRAEIVSISGTSYTLGREITGLTASSSVSIYRPIYARLDSTGAPISGADSLVISTDTGTISGATSVVCSTTPRYLVVEMWGSTFRGNVTLEGFMDAPSGTEIATLSGSIYVGSGASIPTSASGTNFTGSEPRRAFHVSPVAVQQFRLRCNIYTSGTLNVRITNLNWPSNAREIGDLANVSLNTGALLTWTTYEPSFTYAGARVMGYDNAAFEHYTVPLSNNGQAVPTDTYTVPAATPAYGKIAGSSLTTSYQTLLTMGGAGKILQIWNSTEVPVIFSYDGGTTANLELGPYESESVDYVANGMTLASGTIQAKLVSGSAPVNGGSVRAKVTR